jgi:hypothetical protein
MPPAAAAAAVAVGGSLLGGAAAKDASRGYFNDAENEYRAALEAIKNLQIPDIEKQKLLLELPQIMGTYNPQAEQYFQQQQTEMGNIQVDPQLEQAQMAALQSLQQMGQGGLTASEKAVLNQLRRENSGQEQARQGAILQNMAERGIGGSGLELAARLSSSQASADRASQESDRLAAMAQQRALESIQKAGNMAGEVRGQDFGEKSQIAKAKDVINQFNTANRQSLESRNVNALNEAQVRNLQEKQRVADQQTQLRNQQQAYNKELQQKQFDNELAKAKARSDAGAAFANNQIGRGAAEAKGTKDMISGVTNIIGGLLGG